MFGYDEPMYTRPAAPSPRRQPEVVARPKPRPEPMARVSFPAPDDLGIQLPEVLDLPPPEALGIEPK